MKIDVEERQKRAMELFHQGYNCCQSVALAYSDVLKERAGLEEDQIMALASGFGGGIGRLREVCGCVSGMTFVAGAVCPAPAGSPKRTENYALVQELAEKYRQENGSIVCRDLLGIRVAEKESPKPSERTAEYYHARPCEQLVGCAARIIGTKLRELDFQ